MKRKLIIVSVIMIVGLNAGYLFDWAKGELGLPSEASAREVASLRDLYAAGLYSEAVSQCELARSQRVNRAALPQIMFICWQSNRRLGRAETSDQLMTEFLDRFPGNELGADMLLAAAMRFEALFEAMTRISKLTLRANDLRSR